MQTISALEIEISKVDYLLSTSASLANTLNKLGRSFVINILVFIIVLPLVIVLVLLSLVASPLLYLIQTWALKKLESIIKDFDSQRDITPENLEDTFRFHHYLEKILKNMNPAKEEDKASTLIFWLRPMHRQNLALVGILLELERQIRKEIYPKAGTDNISIQKAKAAHQKMKNSGWLDDDWDTGMEEFDMKYSSKNGK